jgi:DNA-binding MarR family transcriptional regulator
MAKPPPGGDKSGPEAEEIANRLHSAAIHLLRRLRQEDTASGLSAPKLSALSVIVFGGPISISNLAAAEQVRPPTISLVIRSLEDDGLVERVRDPNDGRVQRITATDRGRKLLQQGQQRRVRRLVTDVNAISDADRKTLHQAMDIIERIARPPGR